VATFAALGMILGATYFLWLYNCVIFGNFKPKFLQKISNLNRREVLIFLLFVVEIIWMGVYPEVFLKCMHTSIGNLMQHGKFD
jgi:NADH-ubiquinone oxidoreductase chain 4